MFKIFNLSGFLRREIPGCGDDGSTSGDAISAPVFYRGYRPRRLFAALLLSLCTLGPLSALWLVTIGPQVAVAACSSSSGTENCTGDANGGNAVYSAPSISDLEINNLTQNLGQAFPLALETRDPAFPQIHYFTHPYMKLGGDVSDFTYRQAWISGEHAYKITGRKGTARWFNLTVQGPKPAKIPGTDFAPLHEPFGDVPESNIFGHQIKADAEGNFELYIGGPQRPENWLPTTPGSRKLFITIYSREKMNR